MEELKPIQQRYIANFQPQVWAGDRAVDFDAQDEQEWDCTDFLERLTLVQSQILPDVERDIAADGIWLNNDAVLLNDPCAPAWIAAWEGPFTIIVRWRTIFDDDIPFTPSPPTVAVGISAEELLEAIESHRVEVYSQAPPNFCWDIELYQAAGLLPKDYMGPDNDELSGSIYSMRKALEAMVAAAEPVATKLAAGAYVHHMDAKRLANEAAAAKKALAEHSTAKACTCSVHGGEVQDHD